jgi:hypothetical protein
MEKRRARASFRYPRVARPAGTMIVGGFERSRRMTICEQSSELRVQGFVPVINVTGNFGVLPYCLGTSGDR